MNSSTTSEQVVKKHPIRGAIWGLLLGLSLAVYAVLFALFPFTDWIPMALIALAGVAIGVAWAYLAPPKQAKGEPPAQRTEDTALDETADATPTDVESLDPDTDPDTGPDTDDDDRRGPADGAVHDGESDDGGGDGGD